MPKTKPDNQMQMQKQDNMLSYLRWRGDLSLSVSPFCDVDNLILAMDCYLNYDGVIPSSFDEEPILLSEAVAAYKRKSEKEQNLGAVIPTDIRTLAQLTIASARFGETKVIGYRNIIDETIQIQFCALTYLLPDESIYVAFRGTDDTIVGWKEDFMLAFITPVPAQKHAVAYLNEVAHAFPGRPIRLGGHSKGGNLTHYAAVYAEPDTQAAIVCAYSNDGPGFMPEFFKEEGYARVEKRLVSFIPQSSIVGVLLHHTDRFRVIHSTQRTIMQHDPFSWSVMGTKFVAERSRSDFGIRADVALDHWIDGMTKEERVAFTECLFKVISSSGAKTLTEILDDKVKNIGIIIRSFTRLKKEDRDLVFDLMRRLIRAGRNTSPLPLPQLPDGTAVDFSGAVAKVEGVPENIRKAKEKNEAKTVKKKKISKK